MKFTVHFKTPDALDYALEDERDEDKQDAMREVAEKFIKYGENVVIEFDTVLGTATVLGK